VATVMLQVDGNKVRLYGIDAPESKQSCRAADGGQYLCGAHCISIVNGHCCGNTNVDIILSSGPPLPYIYYYIYCT